LALGILPEKVNPFKSEKSLIEDAERDDFLQKWINHLVSDHLDIYQNKTDHNNEERKWKIMTLQNPVLLSVPKSRD